MPKFLDDTDCRDPARQFLPLSGKIYFPVHPVLYVLNTGHARLTSSASMGGPEEPMPKFIIERTLPGAGKLDRQQLAAITQSSCNVIRGIGPQIQWLESFVTDDKIYCVYIAPDEETVREHARLGQFPADSVQPVRWIIDPTFV
jgi:Protein of unknown function (DUF4242)